MKGLKILVGVYISITIIAVLQGCCKSETTITTGGSIFAYEIIDSNNRVMVDTIHGQFDLDTGLKLQLATHISSSPFINSAMAFQCKETILNSIDEDKITLTINKRLIVNGDTLQENENLLNLDNVSLEVNPYYGWIGIKFTEDFFDNSTFENGQCTFKFNAETNDNIKVYLEKELFIDL